jgi:hypothetical protein
MSTSSTPAPQWADQVARDQLDGGFSGTVTVTRARSPRSVHDLVSVESEHLGSLLLTQEQAAELAEVLRVRCRGWRVHRVRLSTSQRP